MQTVPLPAVISLIRIPCQAFLQSDFVGQLITVFLVGLSLFVLALFANKFRALKEFAHYNEQFLGHYRKQAHPALPAIDPRGLLTDPPVGKVYMDGAKALVKHLRAHGISDADLNAWNPGEVRPVLTPAEIEDIRSVCERSLARQQLVLEAKMSRLSTTISGAPSLGLLGTVWGVMGAFMSMATGGASMISAVAPGISGALLTTVAGLVVAIPATVFYNILAGMIRRHVVDMENFEDIFINDIIRVHALPEGSPSTLQLNFQSPLAPTTPANPATFATPANPATPATSANPANP